MECLKIIAIYRFLFPRQEIKIAGGRELCLRDLQSWIFFAGADSFLIGNYLTTYGRKAEEDRRMVADLGLEVEDFRESQSPDLDQELHRAEDSSKRRNPPRVQYLEQYVR
jgi:biotin synthase-like enzyme